MNCSTWSFVLLILSLVLSPTLCHLRHERRGDGNAATRTMTMMTEAENQQVERHAQAATESGAHRQLNLNNIAEKCQYKCQHQKGKRPGSIRFRRCFHNCIEHKGCRRACRRGWEEMGFGSKAECAYLC